MAEDDEKVERPPASETYSPTVSNAGLGDYVKRLFHIESGGDVNAVTGSNRGLGQFGPREERLYGIDDSNRHLPEAQANAVIREMASNHDALTRALGRQPDYADHYLAHQQGRAGAVALLSNPSVPAWVAVRQFYPNERVAKSAIMGNIPRDSPLKRLPVDQISAAGFTSMWANKFNQGLPGGENIPRHQVEDMTAFYNTPLNPSEKKEFNEWLGTQSKVSGRNVANDLFDYDLQGAWQANKDISMTSQAPEKFKKPNHPTFSTDSKYSNPMGFQGGQWFFDDNKWHFEPSRHNLMFHGGMDNISNYFKEADPDVELVKQGPASRAIASLGEEGGHFKAGELSGAISGNIEDRTKQPQLSIAETKRLQQHPPMSSRLPAERGLLAKELGVDDVPELKARRRRR